MCKTGALERRAARSSCILQPCEAALHAEHGKCDHTAMASGFRAWGLSSIPRICTIPRRQRRVRSRSSHQNWLVASFTGSSILRRVVLLINVHPVGISRATVLFRGSCTKALRHCTHFTSSLSYSEGPPLGLNSAHVLNDEMMQLRSRLGECTRRKHNASLA